MSDSRLSTSVSEPMAESQSGGRVCSRSCFWKRRYQLVVTLALVGIISWAIVDAVTKPCMEEETIGETNQRLFCDGQLNATDDGNVLPGQPFRCTQDPSGVSPQGWYSNELDPPQCIREASCLSTSFNAMLEWIALNPGIGWVVTVVAYAALTVALIPGSVLTIGSGVAFGSALGLGKGIAVAASAVIVGATIGSALAFLMGRFLLKEVIENWSKKYPSLKALDKAFLHRGFQFVLLLRLSPVVPFNVMNFVMGSTSCSFWNYVLGTFFGIIFGSLAFVTIGALIGAAAFGRSGGDGTTGSLIVYPDDCEQDPKEKVIQTVVLAIGIVATIVAVVLISYYSRKQFQKLKEEEGLGDLDENGQNNSGDQESAKVSNL